jgi:hypothetical protein
MNFSIHSQFSGLSLNADKGATLRFRTHPETTRENLEAMHESIHTDGMLVWVEAQPSAEELAELAATTPDSKGRTPSKEFRAVVYRAYESGATVKLSLECTPSEEQFETFYKRIMYTLISQVREGMDS